MDVRNVDIFKLSLLEVYSTFRYIPSDCLEERIDVLEQKVSALAAKVFLVMETNLSCKTSAAEIIGEHEFTDIQRYLIYVLEKDKTKSRSTLALLLAADLATKTSVYKVATFVLSELRESENEQVRAIVNGYDDDDIAVLSACVAVDN